MKSVHLLGFRTWNMYPVAVPLNAHASIVQMYIYVLYIWIQNGLSLTLGAHAPEGYSTCSVCVYVSVCLSVCLLLL